MFFILTRWILLNTPFHWIASIKLKHNTIETRVTWVQCALYFMESWKCDGPNSWFLPWGADHGYSSMKKWEQAKMTSLYQNGLRPVGWNSNLFSQGHPHVYTHKTDMHTRIYTLSWVRVIPVWHLEWTSKDTGTCAGWYISRMTPLFGDELCSHRHLAVMATLTEDKATGLERAAGSILKWHVGYRWHANTASLLRISHELLCWTAQLSKDSKTEDEKRWDIYLWKGPAVEKVWDKVGGVTAAKTKSPTSNIA